MATVNRRGQAVTALLAALNTITTANGYLNDVASVTEIFEPSEAHAPSELPAALYLDDGVEKDVRLITNQRVLVTFQADVLAYVTTPRDINAFDADIKRALCLDSTLGGVVTSVVPVEQQFRSNDSSKTSGKFIRPFEITYTANLQEGA